MIMMNKEILIAGEISRETFVEIMEESSGLTAADNLILKINSEGGSAFDGLAIYDALKNLPCSRTAEILGVCASAATLAVTCAPLAPAVSACSTAPSSTATRRQMWIPSKRRCSM